MPESKRTIHSGRGLSKNLLIKRLWFCAPAIQMERKGMNLVRLQLHYWFESDLATNTHCSSSVLFHNFHLSKGCHQHSNLQTCFHTIFHNSLCRKSVSYRDIACQDEKREILAKESWRNLVQLITENRNKYNLHFKTKQNKGKLLIFLLDDKMLKL